MAHFLRKTRKVLIHHLSKMHDQFIWKWIGKLSLAASFDIINIRVFIFWGAYVETIIHPGSMGHR